MVIVRSRLCAVRRSDIHSGKMRHSQNGFHRGHGHPAADKLLADARREADDIVSRANREADRQWELFRRQVRRAVQVSPELAALLQKRRSREDQE